MRTPGRTIEKTADGIRQLRSELAQDFAYIEENYRKNRTMTDRIDADPGSDEYAFAALGYTIHNLYCAFESYFLRIAKFFENNLPNDTWHRSLVERMTISIEGVRPALLAFSPTGDEAGKEIVRRIDELMRFRHLFRSLYKTPLVPNKVLFANEAAEGIVDAFAGYHERFDAYLAQTAAALDAE